MRIFSNFKDYYDIGLQYHDPTVVYERYTEEVEKNAVFPEALRDVVRYGWVERAFYKQVQVVVICGEVYYVLSFEREQKENYIFHNFSELRDFLRTQIPPIFLSEGRRTRGIQVPEFEDYLKQLQFKYRVPAVRATVSDWKETSIETNPKLDLFRKIIDPFLMYQKIETFISNDLAQELNPPVKIEDKYKIPAHGFDRWSFRKRGNQ